MRIASWNVNSLKVRLPQLQQWLDQAQPDVVALQETKTEDDKFPVAAISEAGYQVHYSGQKTYNGVAVLSRQPLTDPVTDLPGLDDPQRRVLAVTVGDVRVVNVYVVNGQAVGSEKYAYKMDWLVALQRFLQAELVRHPKLVLLGDFNIAPADLDVHDPAAWHEQILCSTPEREALQRLHDLGLHDSYRQLNPDTQAFSWWDYRQAAFRRNLGLRIDLVLISEALRPQLSAAGIDVEPRRWERPSDHTPVWAELS